MVSTPLAPFRKEPEHDLMTRAALTPLQVARQFPANCGVRGPGVHRRDLMARPVGVIRVAGNLQEERESSISRCDHANDRRASVLCSTSHAPLQKHRRLPRKRKPSLSAQRPHADAVQAATGIKSSSLDEITASNGEQQLQLCSPLFKWAGRHLPHKQRPPSSDHQNTETKSSPAVTVTKQRIQCSTCICHQPNAHRKDVCHRIRKGCHWLSLPPRDALSPFAQHKHTMLREVVDAQGKKYDAVEALPVVVLPGCCTDHMHGHLLLVVRMNLRKRRLRRWDLRPKQNRQRPLQGAT
ncbi:hypothetical protein HPB50_007371 [Hyalomma asiaticum]|uniref:Uncharacterized protein n=1 Tax=Hyalomma asiaticum TaxID=266040 RepID=A0ACB7TID2_HYAAI|nr:hypothetical protein HPB50_007371 [Hyalomma asiaticum]